MYVERRLFARALRRISILITIIIAAATLPVLASSPALAAAPASGGDPGGNNGTVKVQEVDFDDPPNNDPHVGCTFLLEWYGFDKGADIVSKVTFEMQSPTASVGLSVDGPSEVFVGGDAASGAGTATGLDGRVEYTLSFDGPPHPQQGYHVKLTINTPGSKGADKKHKVFWVEGCDDVPDPAPAINLNKTVADSPDPGSEGTLGEVLTYTFTVTNTGNVTLAPVTITDAMLSPSGFQCATSLAAGSSATCTKTYTVTAADIANGSVKNIATASGKPPTGDPVTDDDDVKIYTPAKPAITIDKTVVDSSDDGSMASEGETLTYTFVITNTGNVPLTDVTITDDKLGLDGVVCGSGSLAVGQTVSCTKTYVVTSDDVDDSSVDNEVEVEGKDPDGHKVDDDDEADIPTTQTPPTTAKINLNKTVADSPDPGSEGTLGEVLTYTFTVTNTGNVTLAPVTITDAMLSPSGFQCATSLAAGSSATCTKTYTVTAADIANGSVKNIATASGKPPTGDPVTDDDDVKIYTPAKPAITIDKTVVDSSDDGSMASEGETLTYTFVIKNTGNVPLTDVTITDDKLGLDGVVCGSGSLAVGQTVSCTKTYVVTSDDVDDSSVDNEVEVEGKDPDGHKVDDDDEADIPTEALGSSIFLDKQVADSNDADSVGSLGEVLTYTFHVTNTGSVPLTDVTISDPMFSLSNAPCVATLAAGATTNCPLLPAQTHTVTAADVAHGSVDNTATTSGTPPTGPKVSDTDDATMPVPNGQQKDANLYIEKTSNVSAAAPGDLVTYTLRVANSGEGDAHNVVVTDTMPGGVTYVSSSAPCTFASPTVTCALGTVEGGDDRTLTITVRVQSIGSGTTTHNHHLDYTKIEAHLSLFDGDTSSATAMCPSGYLATDGSVRLDHVDQGAGTFADAVVLASGVTADGRGWTGTVRNDTVGQVQAKINVVCMTEKTTSGDNHSHPVVMSGPVATSRTLTPGRTDIDLVCAPGTYAVTPSFVFTSGEGVVSTRRTATGWRFMVDVDSAAQGTFSVRCLSTSLGQVSGHSHDLRFEELSDTVTVPAGGIVERRLTCQGDHKGIVAWADMDPGLLSLGNDPQPVTRVFRFYNPTGSALTARYGLLCVAIRTNGGNQGDSQIKNTASVTTSSPDANTSDNSSSATVSVSSTGVAVAPKASVVTSAGKTQIKVDLTSSGKRTVSFRLVAAGKIKGTQLKAGNLLAQSKAKLKTGQSTVRLIARGAAGSALKKGKVSKAKLIVTVGKNRTVRMVKVS